MSFSKRLFSALFIFSFGLIPAADIPVSDKRAIKKEALNFLSGDSDARFWVKLRMPEFFYGKNLRLLNNKNCGLDQVFWIATTVDFNTEYHYGKQV